ncbi:hypothetical protein TREES_T100007950 [Tupaia chinensis]|uniref:Uncharacterized protein n=1 Tax=Tupaia chinensis TaxID=246437 RepID=L9JAF5_TUPCH|nr:hypothetical protein TREES_T100007950 [Tupaia chinensis]
MWDVFPWTMTNHMAILSAGLAGLPAPAGRTLGEKRDGSMALTIPSHSADKALPGKLCLGLSSCLFLPLELLLCIFSCGHRSPKKSRQLLLPGLWQLAPATWPAFTVLLLHGDKFSKNPPNHDTV